MKKNAEKEINYSRGGCSSSQGGVQKNKNEGIWASGWNRGALGLLVGAGRFGSNRFAWVTINVLWDPSYFIFTWISLSSSKETQKFSLLSLDEHDGVHHFPSNLPATVRGFRRWLAGRCGGATASEPYFYFLFFFSDLLLLPYSFWSEVQSFQKQTRFQV